MTMQPTAAHEGHIVLPRKVGLGIIGTIAAGLVAGGIAYATAESRIAALERFAAAGGQKIDAIHDRTVRMETDIVWIRNALSSAGATRR